MGWCDVTCGVMVKGGLKVLGDSVGRLHRLSLLSFVLACKEVFRVVIHSPPNFMQTRFIMVYVHYSQLCLGVCIIAILNVLPQVNCPILDAQY